MAKRFGLFVVVFVALLFVSLSTEGVITNECNGDLDETCSNSVAPYFKTLSVSEFLSQLPTKERSPTLVMFIDFECNDGQNGGKDCVTTRQNFERCSELYSTERLKDGSLPSVQFIQVLDHFAAIVTNASVNSVPRIRFYERGRPIQIGFFGSTKTHEHALLQFLLRMVRPSVIPIENEVQLNNFLFPSTDAIRDHVTIDPVSFILVEPESGSLRSRTEFQFAADKLRAKRFFGHVRIAVGADWPKVLNVSGLVAPAIVRYETGHSPTIILNGYNEMFKEEDMVWSSIERNQFPTVSELGWHNFRDLTETDLNLIAVVGLYDSAEVRDGCVKAFIKAHGLFADSFVFAVFNRTEYADYLRAYADPHHTHIAFKKLNSTFYLKTSQQTLDSFLEEILRGNQPEFFEKGAQALPRLILRAIIYRPSFIFVILGGLALGVFLIAYCACGMRNTLLGLDNMVVLRKDRDKNPNYPRDLARVASDPFSTEDEIVETETTSEKEIDENEKSKNQDEDEIEEVDKNQKEEKVAVDKSITASPDNSE